VAELKVPAEQWKQGTKDSGEMAVPDSVLRVILAQDSETGGEPLCLCGPLKIRKALQRWGQP